MGIVILKTWHLSLDLNDQSSVLKILFETRDKPACGRQLTRSRTIQWAYQSPSPRVILGPRGKDRWKHLLETC